MPAQPPTVNILLLAVNPDDRAQLNLVGEYQIIAQILRYSARSSDFLLEERERFSQEQLIHLLNIHKPHILHFSGHGEQDQLIMKDDGGLSWPLDKRVLRDVLNSAGNTVKMVVLNACYSDSVAEFLIEQVDCVIGMNTRVSDRAALKFSEGLYRALFHGLDVRTAFDQAMTLLSMGAITDTSTPTIRCRPRLKASFIRPLEWLESTKTARNTLSINQARKLLSKAYPSDSDFDAFVLDSFPETYCLYDKLMNRTARTNLLLDQHGQSEKLFRLIAPFNRTQNKYLRSLGLVALMFTSVVGFIGGYLAKQYFDNRKAEACYQNLLNADTNSLDPNALLNDAECVFSKSNNPELQKKSKYRIQSMLGKIYRDSLYTKDLPARISNGEGRAVLKEILSAQDANRDIISERLNQFDLWLKNLCGALQAPSSSDPCDLHRISKTRTSPKVTSRPPPSIGDRERLVPSVDLKDEFSPNTMLEDELEEAIASNHDPSVNVAYQRIHSAQGNDEQRQREATKTIIYFCKKANMQRAHDICGQNRLNQQFKLNIKAVCPKLELDKCK